MINCHARITEYARDAKKNRILIHVNDVTDAGYHYVHMM